jgi:26S proteasome non-ATPase regulatory subunit 10
MNTNSFDPDVQDGSGWTPLMIACSLKDGTGESLVDLLLQKDADVNAQSFNGQTALHFAASKANLDIVRKLIVHKASVRVKDKRGQLASHRAAAVGSVPILKLLLQNRSPANATDMDGMTALHHAISEGHGQAALELLKAGAEADKENVDGKRAIDLAPDSMVCSMPCISSDRKFDSYHRFAILWYEKQRKKVSTSDA